MRTLRTLLLLFFVTVSAFGDGTKIRTYVLPYDAKPALRKMLKTIDSATFRIDAAIYSFTHKKIAERLARAARRGVKVRIIFDEESNRNNPRSRIGYLAKFRNVETLLLHANERKRRSKKGLMHMKVLIVDRRHTVFGSANWTYSAFGKNYEILAFVDDYGEAKRAIRALDEMAKSAKPY